MSEQINDQELSDFENEALEGMSRGLKEIWKIIIFCCVGWLILAIGMKASPLFAIIGALVVSVPSVICVRKYGFKNIFKVRLECARSQGDARWLVAEPA